MKLHAKNNLNERKRTTNYETTHENNKTKKRIIEQIIIKTWNNMKKQSGKQNRATTHEATHKN